MKTIFVLNGPNLNLLGRREPEIYGKWTLDDINSRLVALGQEMDTRVICKQTNHEGELIDALQDSMDWANGVIFNPGGFTHTSVALRDAITATGIPVVEVHMSNITAREEFRHTSLISGVCIGTVSGFGWRSYSLALRALIDHLQEKL